MAGDSRVLMDHNMEIGVTPVQVRCAAFAGHGKDRTKNNSGEIMDKEAL